MKTLTIWPLSLVLITCMLFICSPVHSEICGPDNPLACRPDPSLIDAKMAGQAWLSMDGMMESEMQQLAGDLPSGYCPSSGGSTYYERITSVSVSQNQDKLTILVNVFIANPTGCTAGHSCPEYDSSPEYVNVWIDFNGNGVWEPHEKVMAEAGTGYLNINYQGNMTFMRTVTIPPGAVSTTMLRANLGWGYNPTNPCTTSWTWGNVYDRVVHIEPIQKPQIENIEVSPDNPTTTRDVTFTAKLKNMDGYEVVNIAWSGDINSGNGNPSYTVRPAGGTHGKGKNVTATLTYRCTLTGETDTHSKSKQFGLFFDKQGQDVPGPDNWFNYWQSDQDGACSFGPDTVYSYIYGGGEYTPWGLRGMTLSGTGRIWLYNPATTTSPFTYERNGIVIDGTAYQGIDHLEWIIEHEKNHNRISWNWAPDGQWFGMVDQDGDRIPDEIEEALPGFDPTTRFSFPDYPVSGGDDEEVYCDFMGLGVSGNAARDWANPGKQTIPPSFSYLSPPEVTANSAELGADFLDYGEDTSGNGKFDYLVVVVPVNAAQAGTYWIQGNLSVTDDILLSDTGTVDLAVGENIVELRFEGRKLRQARVDGPYVLDFVFLGGHAPLDDKRDVHHTLAYQSTDFEPLGLEFEGPIVSDAIDANGDGKYNFLNIEVPIAGYIDGDGVIEGWLFSQSGTELAYGKTNITVFSGMTSIVNLVFDGQDIRQKREDGPYHLRFLVSTVNGIQEDALHEAHITAPYYWSDFESSEVEFASVSGFTDYGIDLVGNGLYDVLRIEATVYVAQTGPYTVVGRLFDSEDNSIEDILLKLDLNAGSQTVNLDFSGLAISDNGQPGPYLLRYAFLYGTDGMLVDQLPETYVTNSYDLWQFQEYLAGLTGYFEDFGVDTNGNGLFDQLCVDVEVYAAQPGNVIVDARLISQDGTELDTASGFTPIADEIGVVTLKFNGVNIYASGKDGPYILTDVRAYHTGDPAQSKIMHDVYETNAYLAVDFEPVAVIRGYVEHSDGTPIGGAVISAGGKAVYSNQQGYYYIGLDQVGNITVSIDPPAGLSDGPWQFFVNETPVPGDQSITLEIQAGVVTNVKIVLLSDQAINLDEYVEISVGRVAFDRRTGKFGVGVTITNTSGSVVGDPLWLVIDEITHPEVTLDSPTDMTPDGKPYIDLTPFLNDGKLAPGESISRQIWFNNPNRVRFNFVPSVYGNVEGPTE